MDFNWKIRAGLLFGIGGGVATAILTYSAGYGFWPILASYSIGGAVTLLAVVVSFIQLESGS